MKTKIVPIARLFKIQNINSRNCQKLYGYTDKSNYSKYTYKRKGFIKEINAIKKDRGEIIAKSTDSKELRKFLRKNKIKFKEKQIILNNSDARKLKIPLKNKFTNVYRELKGSEDFMFIVDFENK